MVYAHKHALLPIFDFYLWEEDARVSSVSFNPKKVLLMKYSFLTIISQSRGKFVVCLHKSVLSGRTKCCLSSMAKETSYF